MNNLMKTFLVGALLSVSAPLALADSISASINASGTNDTKFTPTTITLPGTGATAGGKLNGIAFNGIAVFFDSDTLTFTPGGSLPTPLLIASLGGASLGSGLNLYITSELPSYFVDPGGTTYLTINGTGYFQEFGYQNTAATFSITSTYAAGATVGSLTSFGASSATVAPTPEPSSLLLLGSGLVGAAGMMFRRRRASMIA